MGEVDQLEDPVDEGVAEGDEGVDETVRETDDDRLEELVVHGAVSSPWQVRLGSDRGRTVWSAPAARWSALRARHSGAASTFSNLGGQLSTIWYPVASASVVSPSGLMENVPRYDAKSLVAKTCLRTSYRSLVPARVMASRASWAAAAP